MKARHVNRAMVMEVLRMGRMWVFRSIVTGHSGLS
jgi:hypothetical protein